MIYGENSNQNYRQYQAIQELVERFNSGELDWLPKKDLEQIAMLAAQTGLDFDVESKPVKKGLFDLVDTAAFGLVPNKLRPTSLGEEYHGESRLDKVAGGLGTLGGVLAGTGALYAGAKTVNIGGKSLLDLTKNKMAKINPTRDRVMNYDYRDLASRGVEAGGALGRSALSSPIGARTAEVAGRGLSAADRRITELLQRILRNSPTPRTRNINDEIFGL